MYILALAIAGAILFSCSKEEVNTSEQIIDNPSGGQEQSGQDDGTVNPVVNGKLLTSFSAVTPKVSINIGTGATAIEDDDEALVFVSGDNYAVYTYDGSQFVPKAGQTPVTLSGAASVYYPADGFVADGDAVKLTMPGGLETTGDIGAVNPMAGVITDEEGAYTVELGNLLALQRVFVSAGVNINSVTLDYGEGVNYAAGATFTVDASAKTLVAGEASESTAVTVDLGTPATTADVVFFLPTLELANGITFTANLAENHNGGADSFTVANASTDAPARKSIKTMSFYAGLFSGGTGKASDPYIIANARDFKYIGKYCAEGYTPGSKTATSFLEEATYKQTADISFGKDDEHKADLSAYMIGSASAPFKGTYDGNSKTLSNFTISGTPSGNEGVAPFKAIDGAVLQNISISGAEVTGGKFTAGLVGYAKGTGATIQNCSIESSTISDSGNDYGAAGLIGGIYGGTVTNCSGTDLTISTSVANKQYFGGIINYINGKVNVSGCSLKGTTTVTNAQKFGGIVGQINNADVNIENCHNHSTINGSKNYNGGICGYVKLGTISNCTNDGAVNGISSTAGIVGRVTWGIVMDCFAKGTATGGINTGGIVGYAYSTDGNVAVMNCLSNVAVTCNASGNQHSGGVIGRATCCATRYVYIGNCAGLNNVVKATQSNAVRFGAFTGFTNAEAGGGTTTPNRVRIWNSYTLVDDTNFQCANTGATADVGGFVGRMGAASHLGDCYYINDGSKSTLTGSNYKNITQTTVAVIGGTGNIAVNPTCHGLSLDDTFINVLNRCTYAADGTIRLAAFTDYPMCDWTMTGANGEALSHPVQANLVALGSDFYE